MNQIRIGSSDLHSSRLAYGCMRIAGDGAPDARAQGKHAVLTAVDAGYTLFDHADIYGNGACEELFGELLRESPRIRDDILILSKCGIRTAGDPAADAPARYDATATHIVRSVEGSLRRLGVEQLDVLLLHRPDYLLQASELAETLMSLQDAGKVGHFGVSNFSCSQFELLQAALPASLLVNQVEINIHNIDALENGVLDQCQRLRVLPQAWCPLAGTAYPAWGNTFTNEDETRIRAELERQAERYAVDHWLIALAWLLKHPARIAPIIGSTSPSRIAAATSALAIDYRREDWYRLLEARNGQAVP